MREQTRYSCWNMSRFLPPAAPPIAPHGRAMMRRTESGESRSFARDVGEYLRHGYTIEQLRVFDSFPLTHHVECVAVLTR